MVGSNDSIVGSILEKLTIFNQKWTIYPEPEFVKAPWPKTRQNIEHKTDNHYCFFSSSAAGSISLVIASSTLR